MTTFALSPAVVVTEADFTTIVPAVATTDACHAGVYRWGPVDQRTLVDSEITLKNEFGPPSSFNHETWFTDASFLAYGSQEWIVRVANTTSPTPTITFTTNDSIGNVLHTTANAAVLAGLNSSFQVFRSSNALANMASLVVTSVVDGNTVQISANVGLSKGASDVSFRLDVGAYNALAVFTNGQVDNVSAQVVKNTQHYAAKSGTFDADVAYIAKYPGSMGNSLRISVCDNADSYNGDLLLANNTVTGNVAATIGSPNIVFTFSATTTAAVNTFATDVIADIAVGDLLEVGNSHIGRQYMKVVSVDSVPVTNSTSNVSTFNVVGDDPYRLSVNWGLAAANSVEAAVNSVSRFWEFYNMVDTAPGQSDYVASFGNTAADDELHVVIVDDEGAFSGAPGTVLEVYRGLSRASDAKVSSGSGNFYKDVINKASRYVWVANDRTNAVSNTALNVTSSTNTKALNLEFVFGTDGHNETDVAVGELSLGYDKFASAEDIDISLVLQGKPRGGVDPTTGRYNFQLANYIIDNVVQARKDCVAFISPELNCTLNNYGQEAQSLVDWRNASRSTSYAVLDSGYKQMYDKYNDTYRFIPLNGDIAGLCARTDQTNDPWWSPAGLNRGQIKNLVNLVWNPRRAERDLIYKNGVDPVATFPGQGTVLWGDKTMQTKPSAFDRINVRRLFIVLEKAIATAAKYYLFEFNDPFTRAQFKNMVIPYLRDVQGRRGITDFLVVCDESNNTGQVIDSNWFVGDIYIKPERSINWIQLNFVAVGTGVAFSEIVGKTGA